jgi:hypothetical protein
MESSLPNTLLSYFVNIPYHLPNPSTWLQRGTLSGHARRSVFQRVYYLVTNIFSWKITTTDGWMEAKRDDGRKTITVA